MLQSVVANGHSFAECQEILRQSAYPAGGVRLRSKLKPSSRSADIVLDPGFKTFFRWCRENGVPVIIVSSCVSSPSSARTTPYTSLTFVPFSCGPVSGMAPIIRAVLTNLISAEEASSINIIANDVEFTDEAKEGKTWEIVYRHPER